MRKLIWAKQKLVDACSNGWSLLHDLEAVQKARIPAPEQRQLLQHQVSELPSGPVLTTFHGTPLNQRPPDVHLHHGIMDKSPPSLFGRNQVSVKTRDEEGNQSGSRGAVLALVTCEEGLMAIRPLLQ